MAKKALSQAKRRRGALIVVVVVLGRCENKNTGIMKRREPNKQIKYKSMVTKRCVIKISVTEWAAVSGLLIRRKMREDGVKFWSEARTPKMPPVVGGQRAHSGLRLSLGGEGGPRPRL